MFEVEFFVRHGGRLSEGTLPCRVNHGRRLDGEQNFRQTA